MYIYVLIFLLDKVVGLGGGANLRRINPSHSDKFVIKQNNSTKKVLNYT